MRQFSSEHDRIEKKCWYEGADFLLPVLKNSSKSRLRNLDSLHAFVSAATKELMWLNDKEEEEVNFDWSDKNNNMTAKKDNYSVCFQSLSVTQVHDAEFPTVETQNAPVFRVSCESWS